MRRGVHLDHVERGPVGYRDARFALPARFWSGPLDAVEGLSKDARRARLTGPAGAGEQVCVRDPALAYCVRERPRDVLLPKDLAEGLGPVLAIQREIRHARSSYAAPLSHPLPAEGLWYPGPGPRLPRGPARHVPYAGGGDRGRPIR